MAYVDLSEYQHRNIEYIVIHHSASADTALEDFDAIFNWHTGNPNVDPPVGRGWRDIGYHAVVERLENSPSAQFGRPDHTPGAHVFGHNSSTLGCCFVGNFNNGPPNMDLIRYGAFRVIAPWCVQYHVQVEQVVGHNEVPGTSTDCPGTFFDMDAFRDLVNEYIIYQTFPDEGGDVTSLLV